MRPESTLVRIRERSFLDIMDLGMVLVRRRPRPILFASLLGIVPWACFNWWMTRGAGDDWAMANLALVALEAPLATAPLTILLGRMMFGGIPSVGQILWTFVRSLVPMILFTCFLRGVLLLLLPIAWIVPLRFPFLNEVILLERGPWSRIVSRCSDLTRDRSGDLFSQWASMLFFGSMFSLALWFALGNLVALMSNDLTWESITWEEIFGTRALVGVWIAVAFFGVIRFLTYIDQRIRLEGWEVELRIRGVAATFRKEMEP